MSGIIDGVGQRLKAIHFRAIVACLKACFGTNHSYLCTAPMAIRHAAPKWPIIHSPNQPCHLLRWARVFTLMLP